MTATGNRTNGTTISGLSTPYLTCGYDGTLFNPAGRTVWSIDNSGRQITGKITGSVRSPTLFAYGTSPSLRSGATDLSGLVVEGSSSMGYTLTFNQAYSASHICVISSPNGATFMSYNISATVLTINHASTSGSQWKYICTGS